MNLNFCIPFAILLSGSDGLLAEQQNLVSVTEVAFKKLQLSDQYYTEGASIGDVNSDGHQDVIAGPLWWKGPGFQESYSYAAVKVFPIKGPRLKGYSNNFFTFPDEITQDKWIDILKIGIPGTNAEWAINPGDLNKDGKPDIVIGNKKGVFAFIQTTKKK